MPSLVDEVSMGRHEYLDKHRDEAEYRVLTGRATLFSHRKKAAESLFLTLQGYAGNVTMAHSFGCGL